MEIGRILKESVRSSAPAETSYLVQCAIAIIAHARLYHLALAAGTFFVDGPKRGAASILPTAYSVY